MIKLILLTTISAVTMTIHIQVIGMRLPLGFIFVNPKIIATDRALIFRSRCHIMKGACGLHIIPRHPYRVNKCRM